MKGIVGDWGLEAFWSGFSQAVSLHTARGLKVVDGPKFKQIYFV